MDGPAVVHVPRPGFGCRASLAGMRGDRCDILSQTMRLSCDMMSQPEMSAQIALPDGRTLSYVQAGADAGPVVTVLDGPCSRGLGWALAPTARELGIRLLIPDRPGIHGSAAKPGRTMADWPADQLALLDALDIERSGVVTQSGGTGYGVAVAASAPQRLTGLALLGGLAPMTSREARMDAGKQLRTAVVSRAHGAVRAESWSEDGPSRSCRTPRSRRCPPPIARFSTTRSSATSTSARCATSWAIPDAAIEEIRLLARPWGITPPPAGVIPTATVDGRTGRGAPARTRPPRGRDCWAETHPSPSSRASVASGSAESSRPCCDSLSVR